MRIVKNREQKTVCYADAETITVEIVRKGRKTIIVFSGKGSMKIIND